MENSAPPGAEDFNLNLLIYLDLVSCIFFRCLFCFLFLFSVLGSFIFVAYSLLTRQKVENEKTDSTYQRFLI